MPNWVKPKHEIPEKTKGMLVIETDDGFITDYTVWFPIFKAFNKKYTQWTNSFPAVCCPNVNTGDLGKTGWMTYNHLHEMISQGWEIMSHGRHHVGLGEYSVLESASEGDTEIKVQSIHQMEPMEFYEYHVFEGETSEVLNINTSDDDINTITLNTPLQNSYSTSAKVKITPSGAYDLLQGCLDDLANEGIEASHHVYTYHSGSYHNFSQESIDWIEQYFDSGRGDIGVNSDDANLYNLRSRLNNITDTQIDSILDDVAENDKVFIYYGHGDISVNRLRQLKYLIEQAIEKGITITTRTQAVEKLKNSN